MPYGTRDAAKQWQETLSARLQSLGFRRGKGFPAVFMHPEKNLMTLVHGDVYVSAGEPGDIEWFEGELAKQYEIKTQRAGKFGEPDDEVKVLNRIIRRTREGYELEADPLHAELICEQLVKLRQQEGDNTRDGREPHEGR